MKRLLSALIAASAAVTFSPGIASAQPKNMTFVVCSIDSLTGSATMVQSLKAPSATFTVPASGAFGKVYYAVFELTVPISCQTLFLDSQVSGPYPPGINIEGDTSHKPVLRA